MVVNRIVDGIVLDRKPVAFCQVWGHSWEESGPTWDRKLLHHSGRWKLSHQSRHGGNQSVETTLSSMAARQQCRESRLLRFSGLNETQLRVAGITADLLNWKGKQVSTVPRLSRHETQSSRYECGWSPAVRPSHQQHCLQRAAAAPSTCEPRICRENPKGCPVTVQHTTKMKRLLTRGYGKTH